ncbi:class I SAM-dependent methyltransferase [Rhodoflexus sp.]
MSDSQITSGIRSALSLPFIYDIVQSTVSGASMNAFVREHIRTYDGMRILDIGCGTGRILKYLPQAIRYVGYDLSESYINAAKRKYGDRAQFYCQDVMDIPIGKFHQDFDVVISFGVLHHLNDNYANKLILLAYNALAPNGRFITIDPVFIENQPFIAKIIISSDRGRHVRHAEQYTKLHEAAFQETLTQVRHDMLRIPYSHCICISKK